ncbi:MAG: MgtC/SapB family protein [Ruminococcaceae bacterium]|nr:MgtC/SapB family protein [Oscillospiraceae bacterium]
MLDFLDPIRELNIQSLIIRCLLTMVLSGVIGLQRGRHGRAAGLRTHVLVSLGGALTVMLGLYTTQILGFSSDPLRVGAQVISGIGFLGVGTILVKGDAKITGLTTAAGLWATAAIGMAAGAGFYEGAVIVAALMIITFTIFIKLEIKINRNVKQMYIYIELNQADKASEVVDFLKKQYNYIWVQVIPARSNTPGHIGITSCINIVNHDDAQDKINSISELDGVSFAVESI